MNEAALVRFRAIVTDLRSVTGAVREIERQIADRQPALFALNQEAAAIAARRYGTPEGQKAQRSRLEQLRAEVAEVQREINHLKSERERLEPRRDAATRLACRCRDYLVEKHGVSRTEVDF